MSNILLFFKFEFELVQKRKKTTILIIEVIHNCPIIEQVFNEWSNTTQVFSSSSFASYLRLAGYKSITYEGFQIIKKYI